MATVDVKRIRDLTAAGALLNSHKLEIDHGSDPGWQVALSAHADYVLSYNAKISQLASLATTVGLIEQTGANVFAIRAIGVAASTSIPTRADVDGRIAIYVAAQDLEVFKGAIDCSANPNYPAADAGYVYRVSVAGKIGGASGVNVEVNDRLECFIDGSAAGTQAAVGSNWLVSQVNIDGAVIGPVSVTDDLPAIFDGVTGKLIKSKTYAAFKTLLALVKGDVGLGNVDNTSDATRNANTALTGATTIASLNVNGSGAVTALKFGRTTPTPTNVANAASFGATTLDYFRIGDRVFFTLHTVITSTASGTITRARVAPPVASNFGAQWDVQGTLTVLVAATGAPGGGAYADPGTDTIELWFAAPNTAAVDVVVSGSYAVI